MRIQKSQRNGNIGVIESGTLTTHERLLWRENEELAASPNKETVQLLYVKHVMRPLLGPKHVEVGVCICSSYQFFHFVILNFDDI